MPLRKTLCLLTLCTWLASAAELDYSYFLRTLTDLDRLRILDEGVTCKQFSSYDRASKYDEKTDKYLNWGANGDSGHYIRAEPNGEAVMAEMEGPGCIVRIWSANPTGRIRFYLDGDAKPTYEWPFADLFHDKVPPFKPPVCGMDGAGANIYLPIPYAKSCKVAADKAHRQYYHIGYKTFPKTTAVTTFRLPLSEGEQKELDRVITTWKAPDPAWDGPIASAELPVGKPVTLFDEEGPRTIVRFYAKLVSDERYALRRVVLRMYWDGEESPSVECPLGDFFGTGFFASKYESLPLDMGPEGGYCRWRMPFQKKGRIVVINEGAKPAKLDYAVFKQAEPPKPTAACFHAKWRREDPCKTFDYPILECEGKGRFVGCMLNVDNPDQGWWGEGDEKVYVDGEKFPSTFGTGSEDYFGDAWGFRHFVRPFHGNTLGQGPGFSNKWSVYRWHISDDIPFEKSFRITIENYGKDKDYSSVAYWYQAEPHKDFFTSVPVEGRIPRPKVTPGVVEAETLKVEGATVVDDAGAMDEFSSGKALVLKGKAGQSIELPVPVAQDDVYAIVLYGAKGEAHSPFELAIGDRTVGKGDNAFAKSALFRVGKARLAKGEAKLALKLAGEGSLVLDALRLEPSRKERGVIEAESLPVTATNGPKAEVEDIRLPWSADSQLLLPATEAGQSLTVALPVKAAGRHALTARFTRGPDHGQVQALVGDKPIGDPVDCFAARPEVGIVVSLGKVDLTPEANAVTFKVVGKNEKSTGFRVGIDYVRLGRIVVEGAIEAEKLPVVASDGGRGDTQHMGSFGANQWSGEAQLFFTPKAKGAYVTVELTVPKDGRYDLDLYYTKAGDYGIVQLSLDGKPVGKPFDGFNNGVIPSGKVPYGAVELKAGKHQLKLEVVGRNDASTGFYAGVDCLALTPSSR
ncbi:MAG TPA: DUF2961 domain-containing protein [Planctomycetota bacterium]|nr:DUF2961 domain-containing protein [Planctomycetota bacterium]